MPASREDTALQCSGGPRHVSGARLPRAAGPERVVMSILHDIVRATARQKWRVGPARRTHQATMQYALLLKRGVVIGESLKCENVM